MLSKKRKRPKMGVRAPTAVRSNAHLELVRSLSCACASSGECQGGIEAHHENDDKMGTMGGKTDDSNCVPLCSYHHRRRHDMGKKFFAKHYGVNLTEIAAWCARMGNV